MSFAIILQTNTSPANFLDKEIIDVATATGTLRSGTSIVSPAIIIDSQLSEDLISRVNYMYIQEFKRYYYVNEITVTQNHLWRISAHVDVLMSFKEQIRANQGIVCKQRDKWDLYLDDGTFRSDQDPLIQIKTMPSGFDTYEWVLAVAGNQHAGITQTETEG